MSKRFVSLICAFAALAFLQLVHSNWAAVLPQNAAAAAVAGVTSCPEGFDHFDNKCYYLGNDERLIWFKAISRCHALQAELIAVRDEAEMSSLSSYLRTKGYDKMGDGFWSAGHDIAREGHFSWITTDKALNYTKWGLNEPNNFGGNEFCLQIWYQNEYYMNDANCFMPQFYLCERGSNRINCDLSTNEDDALKSTSQNVYIKARVLKNLYYS